METTHRECSIEELLDYIEKLETSRDYWKSSAAYWCEFSAHWKARAGFDLK